MSERRDDAPEEPQPPYPGWSAQQPPSQGAQTGDQPDGWQPPGGQPGWQQAPAWREPETQQGWQQPGTPGQAPTGAGAPGQQAGWSTPGAWAWRPPDAKPGVIPLRPLGVGEILDGAVTTIRKNLGAMLGLAAIVATIAQLVNLAAMWLTFGELLTTDIFTTNATMTPEEVETLLGEAIAATAITLAVMLLATVFLTGMLTVVVGRAVLGEHLTVAEAWARAKGRLLRLFGLMVVYTLIWTGGFIVAVLIGVIGLGSAGALVVLAVVAAVPLGIWLYVRFALSTPSLMLETTNEGNGGPRPVGIIASLRRSAQLVRGAWWRTFGILLLVTVIVYIVSGAVAVPFALPSMLGDGADAPTFIELAFGSLGNIVATTITAPFAAAATALIYVDRRIRREGLDLELARAAGVELPGRDGAR